MRRLLFRSGVNFGFEAGWRKCYFRSIVPPFLSGSEVKGGNKMKGEEEKIERIGADEIREGV